MSHDRLQAVFRFGGKRHYLSTGFSDTPTHRKLAEMKARQIELDIVSGNFDPTLTKYKPASLAVKAPAPIVPKSPLNLELDQLWERYTEFKRPSLSPNTLDKEYATARRCIEQQFPTRSLDQAVLIRDWIVANKPIDAAKRLLTLLAGCCIWAQKSRLIAANPFEGMSAEVKLPKNTSKGWEKDIDPFTPEERDQIIHAFERDRYYAHYTTGTLFICKSLRDLGVWANTRLGLRAGKQGSPGPGFLNTGDR